MRFQYAIRRNSPVEEQRDRELEDYLASLQPTAWTAVTFANSWVNYGGAYQEIEYRKVGDMGEVRGTMKNGTLSATAFTLPVGFRPPATVQFNGVGTANAIDITSAGIVYPFGGTNTAVSLDGIRFSVTS